MTVDFILAYIVEQETSFQLLLMKDNLYFKNYVIITNTDLTDLLVLVLFASQAFS